MNLDTIFPDTFFEKDKYEQEKDLVIRLKEVTNQSNLFHRLLGQVRGCGKVERDDIFQQKKVVS